MEWKIIQNNGIMRYLRPTEDIHYNKKMKFAIFLVFVTYALSQGILQDQKMIVLQSGHKDNLYLGVTNGRLLGINIPIATPQNITSVINQHNEIHFQLHKHQDFWCLKPHTINGFLQLEGDDCRNITTPKACGRVTVHRFDTLDCSNLYGWRIRFVNNFYVLESVQFPGVYLYLNGMRVVGYWFKNIDDIHTNDQSMWAHFIIRPVVTPRHLQGTGTTGTHNATLPGGARNATGGAMNATNATAQNATGLNATNATMPGM
jgi:hypothetical protein